MKMADMLSRVSTLPLKQTGSVMTYLNEGATRVQCEGARRREGERW